MGRLFGWIEGGKMKSKIMKDKFLKRLKKREE